MTPITATTLAPQFHNCCERILYEWERTHSKALDYATGYAKHGTKCIDAHEIKVQALYILNNITHWRGQLAKETRADLKKIVRQLS